MAFKALLRPAVIVLSLVCASCGDEQPAKSGTTPEPSGQQDEWLELKDETAPADWLVTRARAAGQSVAEGDIAVLKAALSTAVLRLGESSRMIANRSAQLETMLKGIGHEETAISLIPKLTTAIGETGQTEGFGAISQHYYTMRKSGLTSEEAVADLRARYGPRR